MLIFGIIFYISSLALGAVLSDYFFSKYVDLKVVRFAMGIPIGFVLAAYLTLSLKILAGTFSELLVVFASVIMLSVSLYLCMPMIKKSKNNLVIELRKELRVYKVLYCGIAMISLVLIAMQYQGLHANSSGVIGADNYGVDFLFHLGIGNSLIYGPFPPRFPYAAGATNVYPFIPDFYSEILVYTGLGLVMPFYMMNFLLYFSIVAIGAYLFFRLSKNQFLPALAIIIFLFCGEGLSLMVMGLFNAPLFQVQMSTFTELHTNLFYLVTYPFFNFEMPVLNNFAPQHEYLLAFPYALTIITITYLAFVEEPKSRSRLRLYLFLGFLVGLIPLIHPTSFIFLLVFGLVMLMYVAHTGKGSKRNVSLIRLISLGMVALAFSLPEALFMHSQPLAVNLVTSSVTNPIWYTAGANIFSLVLTHLVFWAEVFGPIFVIGIAGMFLLNKKQLLLFVPSLILFTIINFIWFPPGFGDSNKYTVYFIFFLGFACAVLLQNIFKRKSMPLKALAAILLISIIFSGVIAEYSSDTKSVYTIADNTALSASSWLVNNTRPSSIFVTNCYLGIFDYLPTIAGRDTLLDMQLYTVPVGIYNYNINKVSGNIRQFMQDPNCGFINEYNVSYVVIDKLNYLNGPNSCVPVNYSAMANFNGLRSVAYFFNSSDNENITVFKTSC